MGGRFCKPVETALRQPIRKTLGHVAAVEGVGTWSAVLDDDAAVHKCDGHVRGKIEIAEVVSERETIRCVATRTGADRNHFVKTPPIERKIGLEHLRIRAGLLALANSGYGI